ncbi:MAG: ABC transporter ATP-binding protein [Methylobacteriaceae bacterium]|jgi:putative ABC transport system ATP-binding protein|nr:ABC transporter ATP-binding protein [Methylobacteriaceae bacterium]
MPQPLISLKNVDLHLGAGSARVHVLKNISLDIGEKQAVGLIGPSGSGKSTLLMVLAGLERPESGSVEIAGNVITAMSEDALARFRGGHIGIVFQSFHLMPAMTALENTALPLELAGKPGAFARAREELAAVGLQDRVNHYPAQLSGGEQQRVAIARAMISNPPILVADEPTGNLDRPTGEAIVDLMFRLKEQRGATLLLVTHDPALAGRCDRMVRLGSGAVLSDSAAGSA